MKTNILVVDDLKNSRLTLGGILEDEGHNVALAENGYQAIEAARQAPFDLIFMDIKMPGINGVQTFREVKKINPKAVVIMMTAYSVEDLIPEALEEGAYAVVYKPFEIKSIVDIIDSALKKTLILVVDEHCIDRESLKQALEARGYSVVTATSGGEALELLRQKRFKIIFLDLKLPDTDGRLLFKRVKAIDPEAAVILMTVCCEEDMARSTVYRDAYTCVQKPFDMDRILKMVAEIAR